MRIVIALGGNAEIAPISWLIERGAVVICAGGGGIPTMYPASGPAS